MKKEELTPENSTIEKEFLGKITPTELISRIIQAHLRETAETASEEREVENS